MSFFYKNLFLSVTLQPEHCIALCLLFPPRGGAQGKEGGTSDASTQGLQLFLYIG
jgi:hypothetical protein